MAARSSFDDIGAGPATGSRPVLNMPERKWPPRRTFLFVIFASTLGWSAIIYLLALLAG